MVPFDPANGPNLDLGFTLGQSWVCRRRLPRGRQLDLGGEEWQPQAKGGSILRLWIC